MQLDKLPHKWLVNLVTGVQLVFIIYQTIHLAKSGSYNVVNQNSGGIHRQHWMGHCLAVLGTNYKHTNTCRC